MKIYIMTDMELQTTKALFHHLGIFKSSEVRLLLLPTTETRVNEVLLGYQQGLKLIKHIEAHANLKGGYRDEV